MQKNLKIIIAEDVDPIRDALVNRIQKEDYLEIIGIAKDGEEELNLIRQNKPDLVVTDIEMPYLTGIEVIEKINKEIFRPDFIVMSGEVRIWYFAKN